MYHGIQAKFIYDPENKCIQRTKGILKNENEYCKNIISDFLLYYPRGFFAQQ